MNPTLEYTSNGQHARCPPPGKELDKSIKTLKYIYSLSLQKITEGGGGGREKTISEHRRLIAMRFRA